MRRREPQWRIDARPVNELGDAVYDVYVGGRRLAWGLKDRAAADRWVSRLTGSAAVREPDGEPDLDEREGGNADLEHALGATPRKVWWNE